MRQVLQKFLDENELNKRLFVESVVKKNDRALELLNRRFNDYVFRVSLCSYIKKSIYYTSREIKKKRNQLLQREKLVLNVIEKDFDEEKIYIIPDKPVDFVEEICKPGASIDYNEILSNKKLTIAINGLTERQKEILYRCIIENKREGEVAEELRITKQAVNKTKNVALEKLKKRLEVI